MKIFAGVLLATFAYLVDLCKYVRKNRKWFLAIYSFNLVVFSVFLLQIVLTPELFLGVAPKVNVFVHGITFLSSFILTIRVYSRRWRVLEFLEGGLEKSA